MAKKSSFSMLRWGFQAFILVIALIGVISAIRSLRAQDNALTEIFDDHESQWNWCPSGVAEELEFLPDGSKVTSESLCQVSTGALSKEDLDQAHWVPLLKAMGDAGSEMILEGDLERGVFRAQGLPFRSEDLRDRIRALSSP